MFNVETRVIINLLGPTGCGKGTQGQLLSKYFNLPHISLGDIFRFEVQNTLLGKLVSYHTSQGYLLAPDEIAYGILVKRLAQGDCKNGFILEGFPVTLEQSKFLFSFLLNRLDMYIPIELKISNKESNMRLKLRRICYLCGVQSNTTEIKSNVCPKCNSGVLEMRADDSSKELVKEKRKRYYIHIDSILENIKSYSKLFTIEDIEGSSKRDVFNRILNCITNQDCIVMES